MILSSLTLRDFRNYQKRTFSFSANTTVIVGANAAGKTNILETLYLLATGKSFRADVEREMIAYGKELSVIYCCLLVAKEDEISLEIMLTKGNVQGKRVPYKTYRVNGVGKRMIDFVGNLRCVLFWPQDLELVTGSPSRRRRYLDSVLIQVDREYRRMLISYEKGLRSRNRLLLRIREGEADSKQLIFWNQLLIKHGQYLSRKRERFIDFVNDTKFPANTDNGVFMMTYDHSHISEQRLLKYLEQEIQAGVTLVGPHRDDFTVRIKSQGSSMDQSIRSLQTYGSRGEQRLGVLWLKLAELGYIEKTAGTRPVLLLDDIFSELDSEHRKLVFNEIDKQQTIITTTDKSYVRKIEDITVIDLDDRG